MCAQMQGSKRCHVEPIRSAASVEEEQEPTSPPKSITRLGGTKPAARLHLTLGLVPWSRMSQVQENNRIIPGPIAGPLGAANPNSSHGTPMWLSVSGLVAGTIVYPCRSRANLKSQRPCVSPLSGRPTRWTSIGPHGPRQDGVACQAQEQNAALHSANLRREFNNKGYNWLSLLLGDLTLVLPQSSSL